MPQLDFLCYFNQFNWLLIAVVVIYYIDYSIIETISNIKLHSVGTLNSVKALVLPSGL